MDFLGAFSQALGGMVSGVKEAGAKQGAMQLVAAQARAQEEEMAYKRDQEARKLTMEEIESGQRLAESRQRVKLAGEEGERKKTVFEQEQNEFVAEKTLRELGRRRKETLLKWSLEPERLKKELALVDAQMDAEARKFSPRWEQEAYDHGITTPEGKIAYRNITRQVLAAGLVDAMDSRTRAALTQGLTGKSAGGAIGGLDAKDFAGASKDIVETTAKLRENKEAAIQAALEAKDSGDAERAAAFEEKAKLLDMQMQGLDSALKKMTDSYNSKDEAGLNSGTDAVLLAVRDAKIMATADALAGRAGAGLRTGESLYGPFASGYRMPPKGPEFGPGKTDEKAEAEGYGEEVRKPSVPLYGKPLALYEKQVQVVPPARSWYELTGQDPNLVERRAQDLRDFWRTRVLKQEIPKKESMRLVPAEIRAR